MSGGGALPSPDASRLGLPNLGDGVGLRPVHFPHLMRTPPDAWGVDWFEIISENFIDNFGLAAHVLEIVAANRPIVMHGVSLSIGSNEPLDRVYLRKLKELAERVHPTWISDHLCWTGIAGINTHDLLPLPLTASSLAHVAERVRMVQDYLDRPLILENPSTYLEFRASTLREWEFLALLTEMTGCGLLLDVNNVYVSAINHGFDAAGYIDAVPAHRIVQIHLAGHHTLIIDAKFYKQPLAQSAYGERVRAQHLYQLATYLQHERRRRDDVPLAGMLLYPDVGRSLRLRYKLLDLPVFISTVDLGQEWYEVEAELKKLLDECAAGASLPSGQTTAAS